MGMVRGWITFFSRLLGAIIMRKCLMGLIFGLSFFTALEAEFSQPMYNFEVSTGYRHDNLRWNIAGPRKIPEKFWTMRFHELQFVEISSNLNYVSCNNYYFRINGDYAQLSKGESRNTAYRRPHDDNNSSGSSDEEGGKRHERKAAHIKGTANRGQAYDAEACLGYQWTSTGRRFIATSVIGWGLHYQNVHMNHARQTINRLRDGKRGRLGHIHDLESRCDTRWFGPFLGFDWMSYIEVPCFLVFGKIEWYFAEQYRANGRWHYDDIYRFKFGNHSNGSGMVLGLGGNYQFVKGWFIGVKCDYRNFQAREGRHRTRDVHTSGESANPGFGVMPHVNSKLKNASWNSYTIELTLDYRLWCDA
jgi:Protochlamydia outer membrane protein